ncbi:MAG: hypothetical protein N3A68_03350 [Bacteroidia bacterium]|jgi:hypothetical protein|nr:hypothetical protein [Bacteroidia bacterium]GIV24069.1 MAG: hypothetical protein KatS3mg025_1728 [Bacteroidia bacterium]
MNTFLSISNIDKYIKVWYKYRFLWAVFTVTLPLIAGAWAILQQPMYVVETEFVPPDLSIASPLLKQAALTPGQASDLERLYSYLNSYSVRQALIDSFQLYDHYHIPALKNARKRFYEISKIIEKNVKIRITRNSTILLRVTDTSAHYAYAMADFLLRKAEGFCKDVIHMEEALEETNRQLKSLLQEIHQIENNLSELRVKYRILTAPSENKTILLSIGTPEALAHYDQIISQENRLIRLQETYAHLLEEKYRRENFLRVYPRALFVIQAPYLPTFPEEISIGLVIGLTALGSFLLSSILILYAYHIGLLPPPEATYTPSEESPISSFP